MIRDNLAASCLIALLSVTGCHNGKRPRTITVSRFEKVPIGENLQVIDVPSGDSLKVIRQGKIQHLKFCGIDASSKFASQSQNYLRTLISQAEGKVIVWPMKNADESLIAEVFIKSHPNQEKSLNEELLVAGLVKVSTPESCYNSPILIEAEQYAKERKVGIWSQKKTP